MSATELTPDPTPAPVALSTPTAPLCNATFTLPGAYWLALRVTDASGTSATANVTVWVPRLAPMEVAPGSRCIPGYTCAVVAAWDWLPVDFSVPVRVSATRGRCGGAGVSPGPCTRPCACKCETVPAFLWECVRVRAWKGTL